MIAGFCLLVMACTPSTPGTTTSTTVPNLRPVAVIVATPLSGTAPLAVTFSGSDSTDPDGAALTYTWSFGDGGSSSDAQPVHTYTSPGSYTARLIVTDVQGATDSTTVVVEVVRDLSHVVLVDATGTDAADCGTIAARCATIGFGLGRAAADAKTQVWVAEGTYPAFTVQQGIDVHGGYDTDFSGAGAVSLVNGSFNATANVSAAIVATGIDAPTTISGLTAVGADESTTGRTSLAAYVGGAGSGLTLDALTLTGGISGAASTALLVDGASTVALIAPRITGGNAAGAGNSAYGVRAVNGAVLNFTGGTVEAGAGVAGAPAPGAPATATSGCTGGTGANASGSSSPGNGGSGCGTSPSNSGAGGRGGSYSGSGSAGTAGGGGAAAGTGGCGSLFGCGTDATGGGAGSAGTAGASGAGASGSFVAGAVFAGQTGGAGTSGAAGTGGGGGGGGKSASASGGGGGGGGGGGAAGAAATVGGTAGGGSFGVYAYNASVDLAGVITVAGPGGAGGRGQAGGAGGAGGNGGNGGNRSCCEAGGGGGGGAGGAGGGGGGAGGGAGGPSIGVLHSGTGTLTLTTSQSGAAATAASGGLGGSAGAAGSSGTGGAPGDCAGIGGCGPTAGASGGSGNAGATGAVGAAGARFGTWDNGTTTDPEAAEIPGTTTTTAPSTTTTVPAEPVHTAVAMSCYTTAAGQTSTDANNTGATVLAPASVPAGSDLVVDITPDPMNVPTSGGGYPIGYIANAKYRFKIPAGTTFIGATLAGGSNLGTGTPSVTQSGGNIVLTAPGTFAGGSTVNFPTITVTFQVTGAAGSTIALKYAGTSYSDPGLSFQTRVNNIPLLGSVTSDSNCFAANNPILASTTIS